MGLEGVGPGLEVCVVPWVVAEGAAAVAAMSQGVEEGAGPEPGRVGQAADRPVQGRPQPPCTGRSARPSVP